MRNINKTTSIAGIMAAAFTLSAFASDAPTFSLSQTSGGGNNSKSLAAVSRGDSSAKAFLVDFVPGSKPVAGVNFDVVFEKASQKLSVLTTDCGAFVTASHTARCEMVAPNRLRVLVFSAPVKSLPATTLVEFQVTGKFKGISIDTDSVAVSDFSGSKISPEVL